MNDVYLKVSKYNIKILPEIPLNSKKFYDILKKAKQ